MLGGMGTGVLPLPPNFEKLLQQGGLGGLPLPPGMLNGSLSTGHSLSSTKRHLPPDAQVLHLLPASVLHWKDCGVQVVHCNDSAVLQCMISVSSLPLCCIGRMA